MTPRPAHGFPACCLLLPVAHYLALLKVIALLLGWGLQSRQVDDDDDPEASAAAAAAVADGGTLYQLEMMKCLRDVNVDNNIVGWYATSAPISFL